MTGCDFLSEYEDVIQDLYDKTEDTGHEHGIAFCGGEGEVDTTEIEEGEEGWITTPNCAVGASIALRVHTHPSGNIGLSEGDWRSLMADTFQYPEGTEFNDKMVRGECVVGKRMGDDDPTVHCVTATDELRGLSIDEQQDLSQEVLLEIDKKGVDFGGAKPVKQWEAYMDECYMTPSDH